MVVGKKKNNDLDQRRKKLKTGETKKKGVENHVYTKLYSL